MLTSPLRLDNTADTLSDAAARLPFQAEGILPLAKTRYEMLVFKYASAAILPRLFEREGLVSLRFSHARDFNDPYELFLQVDKPLESDEHRAFYKYFLGEIGDFPMLSLSRRPDSVVMWAHYAEQRTGICLGFDEDALTDAFPIAIVKDVEYSDAPANISGDLVAHAATTMKARHTEWLLNSAYSAAYFMKRDDWEYEAERRIIVEKRHVEENSEGLLIGQVPTSALRYLIVGDRASDKTVKFCRRITKGLHIPLLRFSVGRAAYDPFFSEVDRYGKYVWDGEDFSDPDTGCANCGEPTSDLNGDGNCTWCAISDDDAASAAAGNMLLLVAHYGISQITIGFGGADVKGSAVKREHGSE